MIKRRIGGKYVRHVNDGTGYYGNNDAGTKHQLKSNEWGTKRTFVGSNTANYTFSDTIHGTHTFTASSFADALRQALAMGFTESDYKKR